VDLVKYPLEADQDLLMQGMVTYVGTSSLNVDIDLTTVPKTPADRPVPVMLASLTFVARDLQNRALPVPQLAPESAWEKLLYEEGKKGQEERKQARKASLIFGPPSAAELANVHQMFTEILGKTRKQPHTGELEFLPSTTEKSMFREDTRISSIHITQPQERNLHGKTFGGTLMRHAFEVAWSCGWNHTQVIPKFLALDDTTFLHPVEVGSLLRFEAHIDFSLGCPHKTYMVSVEAFMRTMNASGMLEPEKLTNTFHFTFYCDNPAVLPRVYPRTYEDAMRFIEAGRRMNLGRALADKRKVEGVRSRFAEFDFA
jgi:acyl-coenzyme A thioesterase 9